MNPAATSSMNAGWKRVSPPPISGNAGSLRASAANPVKKWSPGPNTRLGRTMTASGNSRRTASSPAALVRSEAAGAARSTPSAETWISRAAPASRAAAATRRAPCSWTAVNV